MSENCEFMAPFGGKMLRCSQPRHWRGVRWGGTIKIEVCDGHKHLLSNPEEIK